MAYMYMYICINGIYVFYMYQISYITIIYKFEIAFVVVLSSTFIHTIILHSKKYKCNCKQSRKYKVTSHRHKQLMVEMGAVNKHKFC